MPRFTWCGQLATCSRLYPGKRGLIIGWFIELNRFGVMFKQNQYEYLLREEVESISPYLNYILDIEPSQADFIIFDSFLNKLSPSNSTLDVSNITIIAGDTNTSSSSFQEVGMSVSTTPPLCNATQRIERKDTPVLRSPDQPAFLGVNKQASEKPCDWLGEQLPPPLPRHVDALRSSKNKDVLQQNTPSVTVAVVDVDDGLLSSTSAVEEINILGRSAASLHPDKTRSQKRQEWADSGVAIEQKVQKEEADKTFDISSTQMLRRSVFSFLKVDSELVHPDSSMSLPLSVCDIKKAKQNSYDYPSLTQEQKPSDKFETGNVMRIVLGKKSGAYAVIKKQYLNNQYLVALIYGSKEPHQTFDSRFFTPEKKPSAMLSTKKEKSPDQLCDQDSAASVSLPPLTSLVRVGLCSFRKPAHQLEFVAASLDNWVLLVSNRQHGIGMATNFYHLHSKIRSQQGRKAGRSGVDSLLINRKTLLKIDDNTEKNIIQTKVGRGHAHSSSRRLGLERSALDRSRPSLIQTALPPSESLTQFEYAKEKTEKKEFLHGSKFPNKFKYKIFEKTAAFRLTSTPLHSSSQVGIIDEETRSNVIHGLTTKTDGGWSGSAHPTTSSEESTAEILTSLFTCASTI